MGDNLSYIDSAGNLLRLYRALKSEEDIPDSLVHSYVAHEVYGFTKKDYSGRIRKNLCLILSGKFSKTRNEAYFSDLDKILKNKKEVSRIKDFLSNDILGTIPKAAQQAREFLHRDAELKAVVHSWISPKLAAEYSEKTILLNLHIIKSIEQLTYLLVHELVHIGMSSLVKFFGKDLGNIGSSGQRDHGTLLFSLYKEGFATYAAGQVPKKTGKKQFKAVDSALTTYANQELSIKEAEAIWDKLYTADDPIYSFGWHMCRTIEEKLGRDHLIALQKKGPAKFALDYNRVADKYKLSNLDYIISIKLGIK